MLVIIIRLNYNAFKTRPTSSFLICVLGLLV